MHVVYDTNTWNDELKYKSGDQLFINATLTKDFNGFNIGPVLYAMKQVTSDKNEGGVTTLRRPHL